MAFWTVAVAESMYDLTVDGWLVDPVDMLSVCGCGRKLKSVCVFV